MDKKRLGLSLYSSLLALAVVVSCTVTSSDGDGANGSGDCTPNRSVPCTCTNGDRGTQVCNSSGTGYSACTCDGGGDAGAPNTTGGTNGQAGNTSSYAGEGYGGEPWSPTAGAGGEGVSPAAGGAGGADAAGGAGGSAGEPGLCEAQADPCESCYHTKCCAELTACLANDTCVDEFIEMRECSNAEVSADGNATPAEVDACAPNPNGDNHWPGNHQPETIALIDCMNGGAGWEVHVTWPAEANCATECY